MNATQTLLDMTEFRDKRTVVIEKADATLYDLANMFSDATNALCTAADAILESPVIWNGQLLDLGHPDYSLLETITIVYETYADEDSIAARFDAVGAYGEGSTPADAVRELQRDIIDIYEDGEEIDGNTLGPQLLSYSNILTRIIEKA